MLFSSENNYSYIVLLLLNIFKEKYNNLIFVLLTIDILQLLNQHTI